MYVFDRGYNSAEHLRKIIDGEAQQAIIAITTYGLMRLIQKKYDSMITNHQFRQRLVTVILPKVVMSDLFKKTPDEVPTPENFGLAQPT